MALPVWGLYMKKCYADKELTVSKEAFERPKNLSIKVDCWSPPVKKDSTTVDVEEQSTDEFDF